MPITKETPESRFLATFLVLYAWYYLHPIAMAPYRVPTVAERILFHGYPVEDHTTETADGYVLSMERIPSEGPPVLLLHGLADSSSTWVMDDDAGSSLAYILHDAGFDVWLGNSRGTQLSKKAHVYLSPNDPKFWDFSIDQMISDDFPTLVDYVLDTTTSSSLGVVGHSQGAAVALASTKLNQLQTKVSSIVALAPAADFSSSGQVDITSMSMATGMLSVCQNSPSFPLCGSFQPMDIIREQIFVPACRRFPWFCDWCLCNIAGCLKRENYGGAMFQYYPVEVSAKTAHHFIQMNLSGQMQRFDHGVSDNLVRYGTETPPLYDVNVQVPVALIYGTADKLVPADRSRNLAKTLQGEWLREVREVEGYGHGDLIWGRDKVETIAPTILAHLQKFVRL
jgi:lysosomal acid lipase/cholesteryl ester hydrolase